MNQHYLRAFLTAQGARMGDVVLATNAVLLTFQSFMAYGLDGFAHAAEALIGKAIGRRDRKGFLQAYKHSLMFSGVFAIGFSLLIAVAGMPVAHLMTDLPDVLATTAIYLPWMIASPLISVWSFFYDGVYVGATRAREMRNTMLVSCFLVYIPVWYLLQPLGNHGLWAAFMVFMGARGLTMDILYRRLEHRGGFVADLGPAAASRS